SSCVLLLCYRTEADCVAIGVLVPNCLLPCRSCCFIPESYLADQLRGVCRLRPESRNWSAVLRRLRRRFFDPSRSGRWRRRFSPKDDPVLATSLFPDACRGRTPDSCLLLAAHSPGQGVARRSAF